MNENSSSKSQRKWWQWLLAYPGLLIAIISAIPTYIELYDSHKIEVPFGLSREAKRQNEIWLRNFDCLQKQNFHYIVTRQNLKVGTIVCPSGDVLFRAEASESRSLLKWIDVSTFKLGKISSTKRLIRDSVAADLNENARLAQAPDVLCQRWVKEGILLRRVRDQNGQCFGEIINTYKGTIISREPAPCDSNC